MPASSQNYTYAQLEALWIQAGGSQAKAPIMAAIALAESGGRANAVSPKNTDGTVDRGLWQINSVHGSLSTLDPMANAKAAVKIEGTQGLKAWTTYRTGAYRKFLKGGVSPDNSGMPTGSTSTTNQAGLTGDIGGAIGEGFANAFKAILQPLISTFLWGGEVLLGMALMVGGIVVFIMNTNAGKSAIAGSEKLAVDATTAALPEAAPELQAAKKGITAKEQAHKKAAESGDLSNTDYKTGKKHQIKSA